MSTKKKFSDEYKGSRIDIFAEQFDSNSAWTVSVSITLEDGTRLPAKEVDDESFDSIDKAKKAAIDLAIHIIDS